MHPNSRPPSSSPRLPEALPAALAGQPSPNSLLRNGTEMLDTSTCFTSSAINEQILGKELILTLQGFGMRPHIVQHTQHYRVTVARCGLRAPSLDTAADAALLLEQDAAPDGPAI